MRITHMMTTNSYLRDLYANNANLTKYGTQLSSNTRILRESDDPIGSAQALKAKQQTSRLNKYSSNVEDAQSMLTQTETSLSSISDIYSRLINMATNAANDTYSDEELESIATEVSQLQTEIVSVLNTQYSGQYIFGGYSTSKPFSVDETTGHLLYNGIDLVDDATSANAIADEVVSYRIGDSTTMTINVNGVSLLGTGSDNLYNVVGKFLSDLRSGTATATDFSDYQTIFTDAQNEVINQITDVGAKQSRLELIANRYDDNLDNLETKRSNIEDIDQAEVITKWTQAQTAYQATLKAGSQMIQLSLLDFLD
ncbi:MAG: flagellar hook-associated protein FlgL [Clostridia bacterium]|nr:flagellar hook-associated protein FlgL [Clostridia bacterium]